MSAETPERPMMADGRDPSRFYNAAGEDITEYMIPAAWVKYDAEGRIEGCGTQGRKFTQDAIDRGVKIMFGDVGHTREGGIDPTVYVDLSGAAPKVTKRPTLALATSTPTLAPGQEAKVTGVPACAVRFSGPISGTQEHDGKGPLLIGWAVPGTYTLAVEAWPAMPATLILTVRPK